MGERLITLEVAGVRVAIDPAQGGRAVSWQVDGHELLAHHGDDPVEHGMYAMAPWAGRLRGNEVMTRAGARVLPATYGPWALHGTVLDRAAAVVEQHHVEGLSEATLVSRDHGSWPWPMAVTLIWRLEPGMLTTIIRVESVGEAFPCVVGWHPWFRRTVAGVTGQWRLDATAMLERGDDALPKSMGAVPNEGPFDDAFLVPSGQAHLTWPSILDLDIDADSSWFVVYDALVDAFCVEPQSGPPDGLVEHPWATPAVVTPGCPVEQIVRWRMRGRLAGPE